MIAVLLVSSLIFITAVTLWALIKLLLLDLKIFLIVALIVIVVLLIAALVG